MSVERPRAAFPLARPAPSQEKGQAVVTTEKVDKLSRRIRECETLPALPAAALNVLRLAGQKGVSTEDLVGAVADDAELSGRVLRAVNSSIYGLSQSVSSLPPAVALLGPHTVRALVLGFSLVAPLDGQRSAGFDRLRFWQRAVYAATAARVLAQSVLPARVEDCFVAALLMDLGALVLDQVLGDAYGGLHGGAKTHEDLLAAESQRLGLTHADAGGMLAERWRLPGLLESAMAYHHGPEKVEDYPDRKVVELVQLAGRCGDVFVDEDPAVAIASVRRTLTDQFQIYDLGSDAILREIGRRTTRVAPLFEVKLTEPPEYEALLERSAPRLREMAKDAAAAAATGGDASGEPSNRRRSPRIRRDGVIRILPYRRGVICPPVQVRLKDLSATGIGLYHTGALDQGSQFIVQLPQADGQTKNLLYRVVRCDADGDRFDIGSELTCVLSAEGKVRKEGFGR